MYKVLIVDDEPIILDGLKQVIPWDELGIEIFEQATNGAKALEIIQTQHVDILITDIKMPNMSGIELLKRIRQLGFETKTIILSGYDDFMYVKEAAMLGIENYLLKPVNSEELLLTVSNTLNTLEMELQNKIKRREDLVLLRNNILSRWITDNISSSELKDRSNLVSINLNKKFYMTCLIKYLNSFNSDENNFNKALIKFSIENICAEVLSNISDTIVFCDLAGNIVAIFSSNDSTFDNKLINDFLNKCIICINQYLSFNVFSVMGVPVSGFENLHHSYSSALKLMNYSLLLNPNTIVCSYDILNATNEPFQLINIDYDKIRALLSSSDKTSTLDYIRTLFKNAIELKSINLDLINGLFIEILNIIMEHSKNTGDELDEIFPNKKSLLYDIIQISSIEEIYNVLITHLEHIIDYIFLKNSNVNPLVKRILKYINENYQEDMSLKTLAITLNTSSIYLGQIFKKETGELFSNYLNNFRIQKSKELLINSKLSINEISSKIGYLNVNYFCTVFKKLIGTYPTEYRRSNITI